MKQAPLIHFEILLPAGGQFDDLGQPGLASLHSELLDEGSDSHSALELAQAIESLGGSLVPGTGWNMAYVEIGMLSRHMQAGLELMAEVVRSPNFPEQEIERRRQQRLAEILRRKDLPASLAGLLFSKVLYGNTVYGQPLIGWEETIKNFRRPDLVNFYRHHVRPNGAKFIAVGDFDPDTLFASLERVWGDWPQGIPAELPPIEPQQLQHTQIHIVDRPGSSQTQLLVGHISVPRQHPDFHRLQLLNSIFGGKFTSRINLNLRERHGFTYGANSSIAHRRGPAPFTIRTAVGTEVAGAAVRELLFEMRRIRQEKVTPQELEDTCNYLTGVFPYTLQTVGDLLKRLEALAVFDLGLDFYESFPRLLKDISREDLLETAQKHFQPDNLAIVAVGQAAELQPQLEELGPVTVLHAEDSKGFHPTS
jgi:zinc protease